MKQKQIQEIATLDKIITESSLKNWDGLMDGASGNYKNDVCTFVEGSQNRISPAVVYFQHNGGGKKGFITGDISEKIRLNKLLKAKEKYDLMMTTWIADIRGGILGLSELREDGFIKEAGIIYNLLQKECLPIWTTGDVLRF